MAFSIVVDPSFYHFAITILTLFSMHGPTSPSDIVFSVSYILRWRTFPSLLQFLLSSHSCLLRTSFSRFWPFFLWAVVIVYDGIRPRHPSAPVFRSRTGRWLTLFMFLRAMVVNRPQFPRRRCPECIIRHWWTLISIFGLCGTGSRRHCIFKSSIRFLITLTRNFMERIGHLDALYDCDNHIKLNSALSPLSKYSVLTVVRVILFEVAALVLLTAVA